MKTREHQPHSAVSQGCRGVWPYVAGMASIAGLASTLACYQLWTTPPPPGVADESSFFGELFIKVSMGVAVVVCTIVGGLLGWLIGYLVRAFLYSSHEP
jgi:ribose/xylose/arabinose/galactoside ABC-type transport system permease subunit